MSTSYVAIDENLLSIIGPTDGQTRCYYAQGTESDAGKWFEALHQSLAGGLVPPGGVSLFAPVTRAAIHKRLDEGRLTAVYFKVTERTPTARGSKRRIRNSAYCLIPVSECKAWGAELRKRQDLSAGSGRPAQPKPKTAPPPPETLAPARPVAKAEAPAKPQPLESEPIAPEDSAGAVEDQWHVW